MTYILNDITELSENVKNDILKIYDFNNKL